MKKELLSSILLTIGCLVLFSGIYTAVIWGLGKLTPNKGQAELVKFQGKIMYANIAQKFTEDKYFWPRPSAVDYNAAGSAGSNKGPSNPDYLATVQQRIDTFLVHNPGIKKEDIPADLVTASGSGLDPHISVQGARVQVKRIAASRGVSEDDIVALIDKRTDKPLLGFIGPEKVNVLKLNIELDKLKR
jgi:K+-transporting ATPase ATPase C chain